MAEVVLNLPLGRSRHKGRYHDLFAKISDGQIWKVSRTEFSSSVKHFQVHIGSWARYRNMKATTRTDEKGNVWVLIVKEDAYP